MKIFFEKMGLALSVFSPMIILFFVCSAYLYEPCEQNSMQREIIKKTGASSIHASVLTKHKKEE